MGTPGRSSGLCLFDATSRPEPPASTNLAHFNICLSWSVTEEALGYLLKRISNLNVATDIHQKVFT